MSGASKARVSPSNTAKNCRAETCPTPGSDADLPSSAFRNSPSKANSRFNAADTSSSRQSDAGFGPLQWFALRSCWWILRVTPARSHCRVVRRRARAGQSAGGRDHAGTIANVCLGRLRVPATNPNILSAPSGAFCCFEPYPAPATIPNIPSAPTADRHHCARPAHRREPATNPRASSMLLPVASRRCSRAEERQQPPAKKRSVSVSSMPLVPHPGCRPFTSGVGSSARSKTRAHGIDQNIRTSASALWHRRSGLHQAVADCQKMQRSMATRARVSRVPGRQDFPLKSRPRGAGSPLSLLANRYLKSVLGQAIHSATRTRPA